MMVACLYTRVYTRMYVHACIYTHAYSREMPFTCYTHAHTRNCTSTHTSTHTYKHTYIIHTDTTYGVKYIQAQNISNTYRHKLWRCNTLSMVSTYGSMYTQPVDLHTNQYRGKQTSPGVQRHTNKPELTTPNLIALSQKTPNHVCVCVCVVYTYTPYSDYNQSASLSYCASCPARARHSYTPRSTHTRKNSRHLGLVPSRTSGGSGALKMHHLVRSLLYKVQPDGSCGGARGGGRARGTATERERVQGNAHEWRLDNARACGELRSGGKAERQGKGCGREQRGGAGPRALALPRARRQPLPRAHPAALASCEQEPGWC